MSYPFISSQEIGQFCETYHIIDNKLVSAICDTQFEAVTGNQKIKSYMKIKNGLIRYDFIEFLVRIAQLKYMSSDFAKVKVKTFTEAFKNLMEINIRPVHPDKDISIEGYWQ